MKICTVSFNSWMPVSREFDYEERCQAIARSLSSYAPDVICCQEVFSGRLSDLRDAFKDYEAYSPLGSFGPQTLLTVTLVKRSFSGAVTIIKPEKSPVKNRFNIVKIVSKSGIPLYIFNIHMVLLHGISNKHYDRPSLYNLLWDSIFNSLDTYKDKATILAGDLQEDSNSPNCRKLMQEGFCEPVSGMPTCTNDLFPTKSIDHILYNPIAVDIVEPKNLTVDNTLISTGLSDHLMLVVNA